MPGQRLDDVLESLLRPRDYVGMLRQEGDGALAPGEPVNGEIKPGTYVVEGLIENCYWERTDATGGIIDNGFVPGARRVQVTIRSTDFSFHNEGCGNWRKVS